MIYFDVTIVRTKETKEPVAIFEQVNDMVLLGRKIDDVCDPSICEYADETLEIEFGMIFSGAFPNYMNDVDEQGSCIESGALTADAVDELCALFTNDLLDWCEFPDGFECLSDADELSDRFAGRHHREEGDVF